MNLSEMLEEQKKFQRNFYSPEKIDEKEKVILTKETVLCLHKEVDEVLDTTNWKLHRNLNKKTNKEEIKEEIIDCFKYLLNLCVIWNISEKEIEDSFIKKSKIVWERFSKEK